MTRHSPAAGSVTNASAECVEAPSAVDPVAAAAVVPSGARSSSPKTSERCGWSIATRSREPPAATAISYEKHW